MFIVLVASAAVVLVCTFVWLMFALLDSVMERDGKPKLSPISDDGFVAMAAAAGAAAGSAASCNSTTGCS
jgi:hypothetical protein